MSRLRHDDRGQITTALVIVGTVMVVALGLAAARVGQATDQKSQIQNAADAAALAGAQQIRQDAPGQILAAIMSGRGGGPSGDMGQVAAETFAARAKARVLEYHYDSRSDTVLVSVASSGISVSGSPAEATAEARVGLVLDDCVVPTRPTPPPPPPTTPPTTKPTPPTPTPTPPADVRGEVRCGELLIPIVFDGATGHIRAGLSDSDIRDRFTPALKS